MIISTNFSKQLVKLEVLLTEDDLIALKVHKTFLERMGFKVDIAMDGHEALEKYIENNASYSLAVLDARIPHLDGFDLAKYIREYEFDNNIIKMPIIVISAEPCEELKRKCSLAGIDNFVQKPVEYNNLRDLIKKYISKNENLL